MRLSRIIVLIAVAVVALSHRTDGQQARPVAEQMKLAGVMPRGALVYVQARDLSSLMKTWIASSARDKFYNSSSFTAFSQSRVYLKFQDRKKDIENATGFGLDEARLAELAGGASAVAIYDIGKLEMVFVTEVARERAVATALFKLAPQFQERSAQNNSYYVREVTTDGGRLNQQFCFAYSSGRLIVTSTEGLMIRALANAKAAAADSLLSDVMATAGQARGFSSNELTLWLDQARLNRNRYFNNYWIHQNVESLANIESGLIDLRITPQGMSEQRWFVMAAGSGRRAAVALSAERANALMRFAPADSHLIQLHAQDGASAELSAAVGQALFGRLPGEPTVSNEIPDHSSSDESDENARTERYSRLDRRFDIDVDDEQAPLKSQTSDVKSQPASPAVPDFEKAIAAVLGGAQPSAYSEVVRSKAEAGRPFVRFERAVVVEMRAGAAVDRASLERAMTDELRARFVVSGVDPRLAWQEESSVRFVAQSLLEQGAAYLISGRYLVLGSSREFVRDILQAATAAGGAATGIDGPVEFFALVRIGEARPVFDRLMNKLDGKTNEKPAATSDQEETQQEVKFFSDNLSSLIASTAIREMRVRREPGEGLVMERVFYAW
jgi:hypothetical protein